jgi:thioredoxin-related protein
MHRILASSLLLWLMLSSTSLRAQEVQASADLNGTLLTAPLQPEVQPPSTEKTISWLSIDEALRANEKKKGAKPIFIDLYTDWCGWCKRLDATTFQHAFIVEYLNEHYHAVKFNAEDHGPVQYQGSVLEMGPGKRETHPFAIQVGSQRGQIGYPTLVILDAANKKLITLPGYYNAERLEPILVYYAEGYHNELDFETFRGMYTPQGKP